MRQRFGLGERQFQLRLTARCDTVLHSFCSLTNCPDGVGPFAGLIMDAAGNLYGTTFDGGAYGYGTVFEIVR
jgi:hypothetical protein